MSEKSESGTLLALIDMRCGEETMSKQIEDLKALFAETGKAHHQAFIEVDGDDAEWALWYADYIQQKISDILNATLTKSELVYALVHLDRTMRKEAPETDWRTYYAEYFIQQYS